MIAFGTCLRGSPPAERVQTAINPISFFILGSSLLVYNTPSHTEASSRLATKEGQSFAYTRPGSRSGFDWVQTRPFREYPQHDNALIFYACSAWLTQNNSQLKITYLLVQPTVWHKMCVCHFHIYVLQS